MSEATREIADWLEKLGMSEYAQRFAENGINVAAGKMFFRAMERSLAQLL